MRAGARNRVISIERNAPTKVDGAVQDNWLVVANPVWAAVSVEKGREFFGADQTVAERAVMFDIHWRADLTTRERVRYGDRLFDIQAIIDPGEAHRDLHLMCLERRSNA